MCFHTDQQKLPIMKKPSTRSRGKTRRLQQSKAPASHTGRASHHSTRPDTPKTTTRPYTVHLIQQAAYKLLGRAATAKTAPQHPKPHLPTPDARKSPHDSPEQARTKRKHTWTGTGVRQRNKHQLFALSAEPAANTRWPTVWVHQKNEPRAQRHRERERKVDCTEGAHAVYLGGLGSKAQGRSGKTLDVRLVGHGEAECLRRVEDVVGELGRQVRELKLDLVELFLRLLGTVTENSSSSSKPREAP